MLQGNVMVGSVFHNTLKKIFLQTAKQVLKAHLKLNVSLRCWLFVVNHFNVLYYMADKMLAQTEFCKYEEVSS